MAGCEQLEVLNAATERSPGESNGHKPDKPPPPLKVVSGAFAGAQHPIDWWADYTGVPRDFLDTLPLEAHLGFLEFVFNGGSRRKRRKTGSKEFEWSPRGAALPFWPTPTSPESTIVLAEGESDATVLRYLGADAYAITAGASSEPDPIVLDRLRTMGVSEVVLAFDIDKTGRSGTADWVAALEMAGLESRVLDLAPHLDLLGGEKDIRDLFRRLGREDTIVLLAGSLDLETNISVWGGAYIDGAPDDISWIAKPLLARSTVTLLSGAPKAGKTTMVFKLFEELRVGGTFLNHPVTMAKIMYLTEIPAIAFKSKVRDQMNGGVEHVAIVNRYERSVATKEWSEVVAALSAEAKRLGCDVLVVDTLAAWAGFEDENAATDAYRALSPLRKAAEKHNLAILVIHHLNKGGSERGSTALQAETDTNLKVTGEGSAARKLTVSSNLLERAPDPIEFFLTPEGAYEVIDRDSLADDPDSVDVISVLDDPDGDQKSVREVLTDLGWESAERDRARTALERLYKMGRVERSLGPRNAYLYRRKVHGGGAFSISVLKGGHDGD